MQLHNFIANTGVVVLVIHLKSYALYTCKLYYCIYRGTFW